MDRARLAKICGNSRAHGPRNNGEQAQSVNVARAPIRISILEGDEATRASLTRVIRSTPGLDLASSHSHHAQALREIPALKPQVAFLDSQLLDGSAPGFIAKLRSDAPGLRVVMLVPGPDPGAILPQLLSRANGYLAKTAPPGEIARAAIDVVRFGFFICRHAQRAMLRYFEVVSGGQLEPRLTPRELEVALLLASHCEKEIARTLNLSIATVHTYVKSLYKKFAVHDRESFLLKWASIPVSGS